MARVHSRDVPPGDIWAGGTARTLRRSLTAREAYGDRPMRRIVAAIAALCMLVSCGDDGANEAQTTKDVEANDDTAEQPSGDSGDPQPCPIKPGDIIPANYHEVGCVDTERNDQISMGSYFNCKGGDRLFSDDVGYGFLGEPLKNDGKLGLATNKCDP